MTPRRSEHTATGVEKSEPAALTALAALGTATGGSGGHASIRRPPRRQRRLEPKRNDDHVTVSWCAPMSTTAITAGTSPALDHAWRVPFCT
jgi:hypothetical protein